MFGSSCYWVCFCMYCNMPAVFLKVFAEEINRNNIFGNRVFLCTLKSMLSYIEIRNGCRYFVRLLLSNCWLKQIFYVSTAFNLIYNLKQ